MKSTPVSAKRKKVSKKETSTASEPKGKKVVKSFTVVAIGASAGGLEAVTQLLKNLSPTTGMAYIYVQHLSPDHKSLLTSILSKVTKMKVQDIEDMEKMEPDNVYIIPYNKEIEVTDGHIQLIPRPKNKTSNLSIDVLFSSLAEARKENVIGIVLSGSASDGTRGLKEIKEAGGITFVQDDSAKFTSMPHSAIAAGVVDFVLPPKEIAEKLTWIGNNPLVKPNGADISLEDEIENSNPDLKIILQLLHKRKGVDFSHYKMNTIKRRMLRRMLVLKIKTVKQYAALAVQKNNEVDLLYQDLLINVTDFFRDTDGFLALKNKVLPGLLKSKASGETMRIWVAACATGEEVYSIAMTLLEIQDKKTNNIPFQIFATDLSAEAIKEARMGEYSIPQLKNVSPKRLQQFFTKTKDKYRISKSLRDICVFAQHNVLHDPPFSRMDFISCRNMLIYLETAAQKKAISTFHYALNEGGCLMLGKSETIGTSEQLFSELNKKFKIYSRKKKSGAHRIPDITPRIARPANGRAGTSLPKENSSPPPPAKKILATQAGNSNLGSAFDAVLLAHYMPASVIINYDMEILQFRGSTELYLKHSSGKASFNILKMAHVEIVFELRNAIHHAIKTKRTVHKRGIEMNAAQSGTVLRMVNLEVSPVKLEGEEPVLLIVFTGQEQMETSEHHGKGGKNNSIAKDRRIKKLEEELTSARADMGSITHDQEAANEELQSANEEIVSSNEELQSLNEELETSKEEIESTNEELITSNQELHARIQQVEELYVYYEAILATFQEPMLILDKDMRIKSANKSFCKLFHVIEEDSIGVSLYKLGNNQWNIPRLRELLEDIVPKNIRIHEFEVEQTFPVIGHKTMLLNAHSVIMKSKNEELIVLTIIDVTEVRRLAMELALKEKKVLEVKLEEEMKALKKIEESSARYYGMLMNSPFAFSIMKGKNMVITVANDSMKEFLGKGTDVEGKTLLHVLPELIDQPFPAMIDKVYTTGIPVYANEILARVNHNGKMVERYFNIVYQPYLEADETISGVTAIAHEVTGEVIEKNELKEAKSKAEDAVKAKQQFLSNMSHEIRTPMNAIVGFTNVVLKTKLDAKQKEYINAVKVSGEALIVLINDILDLAKVDAGKMTFEQTPFNLFASVSGMLPLFETKIQEKNLELVEHYDTAIPEILAGDPLRLRQIILNLISNAVKFTEEGTITVSLNMLKEDAEKVTIEFTVTDTGIGIRENRLEHIFEDFEQAAYESTRLYGGTGLGLSIVKRLVELQGGTVIVKSKFGTGSIFGFVLSFEKTNAKAEIESGTGLELFKNGSLEESIIKNVKVLVVEDMPLNQLLIKIIVADFGFNIDIADNGKIAIEKLQQDKYDIILMDLQMPEMNGFDATAYIRNEMNSQIPIIALTADVTYVDVEKCKSVGMNDYISKPIDEKLLYGKMIKFLKKPD